MNLSRNEDGTFPDTWNWETNNWEDAIEQFMGSDPHDPTDEEIEERVEAIIAKIEKVDELYKKMGGSE